MMFAVDLFSRGGPWVYGILFTVVCSGFVLFLCTVALVARFRMPGPVWVSAVLLPAMVGLVGTWRGVETAQALALTAVDQERMAQMALAEAQAPMILGGFACAVLAASAALGAGAATALRPAPTARLDGLGLGIGLASLVVVVGVGALGGLALAAYGGVLAMGGLLVGMRASADDKDLGSHRRVAASRVLVGAGLAGGGMIGTMLGALALDRMTTYEAWALGQGAGPGSTFEAMALMALVLGVAGFLSASRLPGGLGHFRGVLGGMLSTAAIGLTALLAGGVEVAGLEARRFAVPWAPTLAGTVKDAGINLAAGKGHRVFRRPVVMVSPAGATLDGLPVPADVGPVIVAADRAAGFGLVRGFLGGDEPCLLVNPAAPDCLTLHVDLPQQPLEVGLHHQELVVREGGLARVVERSRLKTLSASQSASLWVADDVAVADVVAVLALLEGRTVLHLGPEPASLALKLGPAVLTLENVEIRGLLDKANLERAVEAGRFPPCLELAGPDATPPVRVGLKAVIDRSGGVSLAEITNNTESGELMGACVAQRFRDLQFPSLAGGGIALVELDLLFEREERVETGE